MVNGLKSSGLQTWSLFLSLCTQKKKPVSPKSYRVRVRFYVRFPSWKYLDENRLVLNSPDFDQNFYSTKTRRREDHKHKGTANNEGIKRIEPKSAGIKGMDSDADS